MTLPLPMKTRQRHFLAANGQISAQCCDLREIREITRIRAGCRQRQNHTQTAFLHGLPKKWTFNPNITYHCAPHGKTYHYTTFGGDFGGCGSVPGHTMRAINGWSDMFYGWGGEDQDMGWRLIEASKIASDHIFHLIRADHGSDIVCIAYMLCIVACMQNAW